MKGGGPSSFPVTISWFVGPSSRLRESRGEGKTREEEEKEEEIRLRSMKNFEKKKKKKKSVISEARENPTLPDRV